MFNEHLFHEYKSIFKEFTGLTNIYFKYITIINYKKPNINYKSSNNEHLLQN